MVFSRLFFIYFFLPLCLLAYSLARGIDRKNTVLIIFSLVFYAWGEPVYVLLMILSAAVNYAAALVIHHSRGNGRDRSAVAAAVIFDLLMLGVFKYSGFIAENINLLLHTSLNVPDIRLPIGISFYTFQTISYVIDVYWEKVDAQFSFKKFLLYVCLFPQLIAGPIVRYSDIEAEINERSADLSDISYGLNRFVLGLAKKVLIANQLSIVADNLLGGSGISLMGAWLGAAVYGLQIYFDFSGYSDMAIGMGRVFGFHFNENFRHPFICKDITEFWQRWHISLSTFFRDYLLYIPIFGKRRKYGGLFLVWLCTGIWHGASWNYIIWGLYYGLFVFMEMQIGKKRMKSISTPIRHIYSKLVIIIGFGIFYFEDLGKLGRFFKALIGLGGSGVISASDKLTFFNNIWLIIAAVALTFPIISTIKKYTEKNEIAVYVTSGVTVFLSAALLVLTSIMLVDATTNPFLYFRF